MIFELHALSSRTSGSKGPCRPPSGGNETGDERERQAGVSHRGTTSPAARAKRALPADSETSSFDRRLESIVFAREVR